MARNNELQSVEKNGRLQGFANLFRKENHLWWRTSRWFVQTLIWFLIVNGILFLVIGVAPKMEQQQGQNPQTSTSSGNEGDPQQSLAELGLSIFLKMAGIAIGIGVVVLAQDTLIGEKQSGTASWVLSKPVSRVSYILSKVSAFSLGILITMVVIQGGIAYLLIFLVTGKSLPILPYIGAMGMLFLSLIFWLTLGIMLSTLSNMRGLVIGIPIFLLLGFELFVMAVPWVADYMPWSLTSTVSASRPAIAVNLVLGQPIPTWMPLFATLIGCLLFILFAIWRFQKEEL